MYPVPANPLWSSTSLTAPFKVSERTARTHVSNVLAKMQLASRTQAALVAIQEGLVAPERLDVHGDGTGRAR